MTETFGAHIQEVYELEMFYGDQNRWFVGLVVDVDDVYRHGLEIELRVEVRGHQCECVLGCGVIVEVGITCDR